MQGDHTGHIYTEISTLQGHTVNFVAKREPRAVVRFNDVHCTTTVVCCIYDLRSAESGMED